MQSRPQALLALSGTTEYLTDRFALDVLKTIQYVFSNARHKYDADTAAMSVLPVPTAPIK